MLGAYTRVHSKLSGLRPMESNKTVVEMLLLVLLFLKHNQGTHRKVGKSKRHAVKAYFSSYSVNYHFFQLYQFDT